MEINTTTVPNIVSVMIEGAKSGPCEGCKNETARKGRIESVEKRWNEVVGEICIFIRMDPQSTFVISSFIKRTAIPI